MKIAYYEQNNYHTEIMGTFLEYFTTNKGCEIVVYNSADKSSTVSYFNKFCNFALKPHTELASEHQLFDKIIIGTSSDCEDFIGRASGVDFNKVIYVCHLKSDIRPIYQNIIVLTPLNNLPKTNYLLPIHNYITEIVPRKKNILTIIGRFKDNNRDTADLVKLITNYNHLDFCVQIFSRVAKFVPKVLFELSATHPTRLRISLKTPSDKMDTYLRKSKFILPLVKKNSWYYKDRLSGSIALAYNYNVPLIMDKQLQNIYGTDGIFYENSLSEIIETVVKMPDETYNELVTKFIYNKNQLIARNHLLMDGLVQ